MENKIGESALFALITGASNGIGKSIAEELASRNYNLLLVALPNSNLDKVAEDLENKYSVRVHYFEIDLTTEDAPKTLYNWFKKNDYKICILVNNAGIGHEGLFESTSYSFIENMMKLNMNAVVHLTYLFLPELRSCKDAYILNVGSLASFGPIPFKIIYTGSKSFVFFFTRALREELLNSSIKVSILCPGPVFTNEKVERRTNSKGVIAKMMVMTAKEVASIAVIKMLKGKPVIIPGTLNRFLLIFQKFIPLNNQMKILGKLYKNSM